MWPRTRDGEYSVKTSYQLLVESDNRGEASGSNNDNLRSFWKGIWKMRVPNKIKNFCWRACSESLPTLANLHRRKVVTSPICTSCGTSRETVVHAIWECDQVQNCWGHAFMMLRQVSLQWNSLTDLVSAARKLEGGLELFMVIAWLVWSRRNKRHFQENCMPPEKIRDAAESVLKEFRGSQKSRPERVQRPPQRWVPPEPGSYKVNYDGAYFAEEEAASIGVVVRNELGQVMASLAEKIAKPPTVESLEALAARRAMVFMEELGLYKANF